MLIFIEYIKYKQKQGEDEIRLTPICLEQS